jgi:hypothetical protein
MLSCPRLREFQKAALQVILSSFFPVYKLTPSRIESKPDRLQRAIVYERYGQDWANFEYGRHQIITGNLKQIKGKFSLPEGYDLAMLPRHAAVRLIDCVKCTEIKYAYNLPKIVIAIVQLLYALISLYHARVYQITQFGYAAFGLTVAPYAVMSFMNLISCLLSPDFEEVYIISSGVMEEARARGGVFEEIAGELVEEESGIVKVPETEANGFIKQRVTRLVFAQNDSGQMTMEPFDAVQISKPKIETPKEKVQKDTAPEQTGQSLGEKSTEVKSAIAAETSADTVETATTNSTSKYAVFYNQAELQAAGYPLTAMFWFPICNPFKSSHHPLARLFCTNKQNTAPPLAIVNPLSDGSFLFKYSITDIMCFIISTLVYGLIIGIIGGVSRFHRGESTSAQRVWTMLWLATGLSIFLLLEGVMLVIKKAPSWWVGAPAIALFFVLFTPGFGGFVVVGQMLRSYGSCVALS